jgi:predicted nucleic acid-binding Zn finger protein
MLNSYIGRHIEARKDTFYRLKNNPSICWRLVLWLFATKFRKCTEEQGEKSGSVKCIVFDDTLLDKTGRCIEKVSRVWDHVTGRFILGFKMLLMGYWDGTSFIPVDFSLHREKGRNKEKPFGLKKKELKKQYRKNRRISTYSHERSKEADTGKIESALKMFSRAIAQGFKADYLLMDSWFTCEAFIDAVLNVKHQVTHLIGMYKTPKTKFEYMGGSFTYSQIRNLLGKSKRCRKLGLYYNQAIVGFRGKQIKLFFSKQGKSGKWKVFITTNTSLSFIKMIEIYQIRWSIEVLFKEAKQLLGLGNCQSNDFDAQIADTTITLIQHILLTLRYRFDHYESMGALFAGIKEGIISHRLNERLWGLFIELLKLIDTVFIEIDEDLLLERIINNDKAYEKLSIILSPENERIAAYRKIRKWRL